MPRRSIHAFYPHKGPKKHTGVIMIIGVPRDLRARFKAICASQQRCMKDVLIESIREFCARNQLFPGIPGSNKMTFANKKVKRAKWKGNAPKHPRDSQVQED